jgi:hypothetical protein
LWAFGRHLLSFSGHSIVIELCTLVTSYESERSVDPAAGGIAGYECFLAWFIFGDLDEASLFKMTRSSLTLGILDTQISVPSGVNKNKAPPAEWQFG